MRIKKLEMKNFRGFEELTVEFPEEGSACVVVGVNGSGKTSVLECIKSLLIDLSMTKGSSIGSNLEKTDIKLEAIETENRLEFYFEGKLGYINTKFRRLDNPISSYNSNIDIAQILTGRISSNLNASVPVFCIYPTNRFVTNNPSLKVNDISSLSQLDAFSDLYSSVYNFSDFFRWFRNTEDRENEKIRFNNDIEYREKGLETVRKAIKSFLPNFSNPRVQRQPQEELIVEKNGKKLSISNLSHGEKGMFAMIGDITRRLSLANPSLENPLNGEGIVLIDEIELHLHPGWQRTIVPRLEKTFPNIQFILTTHSPQVLSTMKRENVFILEDFKLVENTPYTYGKDSNSILYDLFGVEERPEHAKKEFKKLYQLIDDANMVKEAKEEYQKMKEKYGEFDPEILRAGTHLDFLTD